MRGSHSVELLLKFTSAIAILAIEDLSDAVIRKARRGTGPGEPLANSFQVIIILRLTFRLTGALKELIQKSRHIL